MRDNMKFVVNVYGGAWTRMPIVEYMRWVNFIFSKWNPVTNNNHSDS